MNEELVQQLLSNSSKLKEIETTIGSIDEQLQQINHQIKDLKDMVTVIHSHITDSKNKRFIQESNVSMLQSIANSEEPKTKYPKNRIFIKTLIHAQEQRKHDTKFLQSLLDNQYDTVTLGQYNVIKDIAGQNGIQMPKR